MNPAFFTVENMFDLIRSSSGMAILAVGFFVVLLSGGIDISFPAVAIVAQYITVNAIIALGIDNLWLGLRHLQRHRHRLRRGERLLHLRASASPPSSSPWPR